MATVIPRTLEAVREAIYHALTSPPLVYTLWDGTAFSPKTLPATSVVPKAQWNTGAAIPSPLVAFTVGRNAPFSAYVPLSVLTAKVWVSASSSSDEVTQIAEAVNAILNFGDEQGSPYGKSLSRAGGAANLPVIFNKCVVTRQSDPAFEDKTNRWYVVIQYEVVAL
ncbi:MAG: hypothetical protein ACR2KS_10130 [Candidatus Eremiobacter antarcticus]|nr:hypothetical protein [Candidatus Eremiobacteraeota bacterium]MBC5808791.1 hypothetical protein [Candidatus Eremiobacteraeota bacterium]